MIFIGIRVKALAGKGLEAFKAIYQQSYPQISGVEVKSFMNQRLNAYFVSLHQGKSSATDFQAAT
ncbi:MAG: hypothetical protein ACI9I0_001624 [Rhodoferax sp.]